QGQRRKLVAMTCEDAETVGRFTEQGTTEVMYGRTSPEEAVKMVTLNPAIMLRIDARVGSLKVGKDADVVLWSDNPLSVYAKTEQTYVDGVKYWDIEEYEAKIKAIEKERSRIIDKMLDTKSGKPSGPRSKKEENKGLISQEH